MSPGPGDDRPDVIRSEVDPDYDCVRLGATAPGGAVASPPPGGDQDEPGRQLCPDGYVPRRRRPPYRAEGKRVVRDDPPERNPSPPPDRA